MFFYSAGGGEFSDTNSLLLVSSSHQYVDLGNNFRYQTNQAFSISAWIYLKSLPNNAIIFGNENVSNGGYFIKAGTSGTLDFGITDETHTLEIRLASVTLINGWHSIIATFDGSASANGMKLYVDGALASTSVIANSNPASITYASPTWIGGDSFNEWLNGYVDEVAVFNTALSSGDVTTIYNTGAPGDISKVSGIVAWYRMGDLDDTSSTIYDRVGSANGTVTNGATIVGFVPFITPNQLSRTQIKNDPSNITVSNNLAYIPYYQSGNIDPGYDAPDMQIWNISSPGSPSLTGTLPSTGIGADGRAPYFATVSGNYAYIPYYKDVTYLRIVDVSNPASPSIVGSVTDILLQGVCAGVYGNYVYVSGYNNGSNKLAIVDVTSKSSPSLVGYISIDLGYTFFQIYEKYMFLVSNASRTLKVYDLTTPTSPSQVASISTTADPISCTISPDGKTLYIVDYNSALLEIADVSTPTSPIIKSSIATDAGAINGILRNNLFYVVCYGGFSMKVYSVYDPANPFLVGTYSLGASESGTWIYAVDKYAYVTTLITDSSFDMRGFLHIYQVAP